MQFAIATYLNVHNPEAAARFLEAALNFKVEYKSGYGWWAENGAISIILQKGDSKDALIEVQCSNIENDSAPLLARSDIKAFTSIQQQKNRIEQTLIADCGITLKLSKVLNEDEMGELIELPSTLPWDEQTDLHTRRILRVAPLSFREKAREQVTQRAEYLAVEAGVLHVQEEHAMQAFVDITLDFQYQALFDAIQKEGIDASTYLQEPNAC